MSYWLILVKLTLSHSSLVTRWLHNDLMAMSLELYITYFQQGMPFPPKSSQIWTKCPLDLSREPIRIKGSCHVVMGDLKLLRGGNH